MLKTLFSSLLLTTIINNAAHAQEKKFDREDYKDQINKSIEALYTSEAYHAGTEVLNKVFEAIDDSDRAFFKEQAATMKAKADNAKKQGIIDSDVIPYPAPAKLESWAKSQWSIEDLRIEEILKKAYPDAIVLSDAKSDKNVKFKLPDSDYEYTLSADPWNRWPRLYQEKAHGSLLNLPGEKETQVRSMMYSLYPHFSTKDIPMVFLNGSNATGLILEHAFQGDSLNSHEARELYSYAGRLETDYLNEHCRSVSCNLTTNGSTASATTYADVKKMLKDISDSYGLLSLKQNIKQSEGSNHYTFKRTGTESIESSDGKKETKDFTFTIQGSRARILNLLEDE